MKNNYRIILSILLLLPFIAGFISITTGAYHLEPSKVFGILFSHVWTFEKTWNSTDETVLLYVRLPRIVLCVLVGISLSVSGAILQAVFRNPLVSPYLLGISSGASFGASLVIVLIHTINPLIIQFSAFLFGVSAVIAAYTISKMYGERNNTVLVLSGVIVSGFFSAMVTLIQYLSEKDKLQAIVFWMMGSLSSAQWSHVLQVAPLTCLGCILSIFLSWRINVLSLGDQEAQSLGLNPEKLRALLVLITTLMTTSVVAVTGPIGWVGLIIPHLVRMLVGANNQYVITGSIGLGAVYLIVIDLISRNLLDFEIPVGIITALMGCPFFIYLIYKTKQPIW